MAHIHFFLFLRKNLSQTQKMLLFLFLALCYRYIAHSISICLRIVCIVVAAFFFLFSREFYRMKLKIIYSVVVVSFICNYSQKKEIENLIITRMLLFKMYKQLKFQQLLLFLLYCSFIGFYLQIYRPFLFSAKHTTVSVCCRLI